MVLNEGLGALTEKERQTLRLMVRGHDAKSIARDLGLSVHTINERLRDARRKMAVSSSREAARLLLAAEGDVPGVPAPDFLRDTIIGEDAGDSSADQKAVPVGTGRTRRPFWIALGVLVMTLALGLLALVALPQIVSSPSPAPAVAAAQPDAKVVDTARQWLALGDQGRWEDGYRQTGTSFHKLNTAKAWAAASEKVRVPLGAMISRSFVSEEDIPAPPSGCEVVKFRTSFAAKPDAIETVALDREHGRWRVIGVTIG